MARAAAQPRGPTRGQSRSAACDASLIAIFMLGAQSPVKSVSLPTVMAARTPSAPAAAFLNSGVTPHCCTLSCTAARHREGDC